ncbi:hypothetical protein PUNSTDRAFT_64110 [Punctularia strigosozonata HHB-11173 SS5]|uniref:uncharacterized protein n=1 Tax=Punctularia strigosozonata (strain HHB-11173) TaxID=741275 RepID=UPI0004417A64|nr:uncharacterized protein PUNSTDRAFT_64110 [Punctularia strigosozonata HHB-11173 SS5]EIN10894.1 hypothetical protein PUNSTDRAFT_64110 [Punctularia strigosozonata HHB-11173 SS5]
MSRPPFPAQAVLDYLGLPRDYTPSPEQEPVEFLSKHLHALPPHLLAPFSAITTPKQRTALATIRNRRLRHVQSGPPELAFDACRRTWPTLWHGRDRRFGQVEGADEEAWARREFMGGAKTHLGKLGTLLGGYEEERESERVRMLRRVQAESTPEEEEDSEDEEDEEVAPAPPPEEEEEESSEEEKTNFVRIVQERFIYGLLDSVDYDAVDWNDALDAGEGDREAEERWFEDESDTDTAHVERSDEYDY